MLLSKYSVLYTENIYHGERSVEVEQALMNLYISLNEEFFVEITKHPASAGVKNGPAHTRFLYWYEPRNPPIGDALISESPCTYNESNIKRSHRQYSSRLIFIRTYSSFK